MSQKTLIRLRTPLAPDVDVETALKVSSQIPGAILAYQEGDFIISLHEDSLPESADNPRATRVPAMLSPTCHTIKLAQLKPERVAPGRTPANYRGHG